jgi:FkbM family methyltransferase
MDEADSVILGRHEMQQFRSLFRILGHLSAHPLTANRKLSAYARFLRWQFGSRILKYPVLYPFVEDTCLIAANGLTGATGMIYVGLVELNEMALVLHYLRDSDVFLDVGANIGAYTVLASGVSGAKSIAIEPVPQTYAYLKDNVTINHINHKVRTENVAAGSQTGILNFTTREGATNHVLAPGELQTSTVPVLVKQLDSIVEKETISLLKIDVEGFEMEVVKGAIEVLSNPGLKIVVMELRGHGIRYGFNEMKVHHQLLDYGFCSYVYDPFARVFSIRDDNRLGDMIYIRDVAHVRNRVATAGQFLLNTGDEI